jgi:hypothetical protein
VTGGFGRDGPSDTGGCTRPAIRQSRGRRRPSGEGAVESVWFFDIDVDNGPEAVWILPHPKLDPAARTQLEGYVTRGGHPARQGPCPCPVVQGGSTGRVSTPLAVVSEASCGHPCGWWFVAVSDDLAVPAGRAFRW